MRRIARSLLVAALAAPLVPAAAHSQGGDRLPLGIWAGVTSSTFRGSDAPGPTNLAGFSAGVFTQWRFAPYLALQPEIDFTQKGSDELDAASGSLFTMHIRLTYIEVPVLLRMDAPAVGPLTPFALAGPEVAFKVGCSVVVGGLAGGFSCADLPPAASTDFGGVLGAGVAFNVAGRRYGLSARYDAGFTNAFTGNDAKNRAWTLLLGTVFR
jgi:hypothetical protein